MKKPSRALSFALLAAFWLGLGSAGAVVRRADKPDSAYLKLGANAAFASVGRVEVDYGDGDGYVALGTATLFGRDRLVSAAHVFDSDALFGARGLRINFGGGRVQAIDFRSSGVVNINPGYDSQTLKNDVSVVFLAKKFRLNPGAVYAGKRIALEKRITFIGYGSTGTGLTGSYVYSNRKRGGQNALGRYTSGGAGFEVDFDHPTNPLFNSLGSSSPRRLEGLLGPGDSGGSAWAKVGKKWRLIGINSYGVDWFPNANGNGVEDDYGDRSGFIYLPNYANWLKSLDNPFFSRAANSSALTFTAVPEPGTIALVLFGSVALLVRRRRA